MNLITQTTAMIRRHWIALLAGALILLAIAPLAPAWAGPPSQTVPQPTATPTTSSRPATATPTRRPSGGNDGGGSEPSQPAPTPTPPPPSVTELTATVNVRSLNVREGPGVNYAVLGVVSLGDALTVIGRNEEGNWWFVCCVSTTGGPGWVSAAFLTPNFAPEQANDLPITSPLGAPVPPTPTPEPTVAASEPITGTTVSEEAKTDVTGAVTETMTNTTAIGATTVVTSAIMTSTVALEVTITQDPLYAWQGHSVDLIYTVANPGDEEATNVTLRNELPSMLAYTKLAVDGEGESIHAVLDSGADVIEVRWPVLAPGEQVTATLTVRISPDAPNGMVIPNTVAVDADNADSASAGINIGLPPATLPDFK